MRKIHAVSIQSDKILRNSMLQIVSWKFVKWEILDFMPGGFIPANCHTFGVFLLIFGLSSRFVTHSLIVTHFADLPLIFVGLPLILMVFATHFHSYIEGMWNFDSPRIFICNPNHTFEKFWLAGLWFLCQGRGRSRGQVVFEISKDQGCTFCWRIDHNGLFSIHRWVHKGNHWKI